MRKAKWLVMVSIFVVVFVVFEIIIHLKQQEQIDIAEKSNDVVVALQDAMKNEVEDIMYQYDEFLELEMKKIPEGEKEIDIAPFESREIPM